MKYNYRFLAILLCLFLTSSISSIAQNYSFYWDKSYGGDSRDWNCKISSDASGNIFLIGDSQSEISGNKTVQPCSLQLNNADLWLIKIDTAGSILWQKGYGGNSDERLPQLVHLNNPAGEMLIGSYSTSDIGCDKTEANRDSILPQTADYWLCKIDASGNLLWDKTLGGENFDDYTKIGVFSNGSILVAGESNSPVGFDKTVPNYSISNDFWALKLDASGNILWDNVYGGDQGEFIASVICNADGTFLLAGYTNSGISGDISQASQGNYDYWVIKVDGNGNKIWDKRFGGTGPELMNHAIATNDGGYVLCGYTVSPMSGDVSEAPKGFQDMWVVKIDSVGNKIWDKRFGGSGGSFGTNIRQQSNGYYWVSGYSNSNATGDMTQQPYGGSDYWVLYLNTMGDKIFDRRFGGSGDEFGASLIALADSSIMVFGYSDSGTSAVKNSPSYGWYDYWLVKFSYTDSTTSVKDPVLADQGYTIFPNPATDGFYIRKNSETGFKSDDIIRITDLSGRLVLKNKVAGQLNYGDIYINTSTFSKGTYLLSIENKDSMSSSYLITIQ